MDVSSSTSAPAETGKDPMKKALEVQEQQVLKILEGLEEQSKDMQQINASQKTGIGNSIDILS
ncbi:MAG: hypothetical protein L3J19_07860 [Sulfurimonas sp.]|nr:hypothetical protein [Sulfurimonas sp.]